MVTLSQLNALSEAEALEQFLGCCHCQRWARDMTWSRPYRSFDGLLGMAKASWERASREEILEAFGGHARIGDIEVLRSKYAGVAGEEQGQVAASDERVLRELFELNRSYEQRHGFIFIVCATGKSAAEMAALLRQRIDNTTPTEIANGAREQAAITEIRLRKLVSDQE